MTSSEKRAERRRWLLILACAVIATLPLAILGDSCGHDFDFHLESWLDVKQQWNEGVLYPHWAASANYGAGEPRFVFYPPLSWMLGALLGTILPWAAAPVILTLIAFAASGVSMYALARTWMPRDQAAGAACIYIANPYLLFVAYERAAYGELLAAIWLPLIFLFAFPRSTPAPGAPGLAFETWDYPNPPEHRHPERLRAKRGGIEGPAVPLALAIAAVWLTNAPAAVMACYAIALVALWVAIAGRKWRPIFQALAGLLLGLGLAAFYIVPAAYERRWVEIDRAIGPGMRVQDSFLFGNTGEAFHDHVLHTASWIAVAMLAACVVAGCAAWKRGSQRLLQILAASSVLICFLLLPVSAAVWRFAPELKFVQFPWRLLLLLGVVLATLAGLALSRWLEIPAARSIRILLPLLFATGMALFAARFFWQPCDEEDAVSAQIATSQSAAGFEGTDEYTMKDADNSDIQQHLPRVRILDSANAGAAESSIQPNPEYAANPVAQLPAKIVIVQWLPEQKIFDVDAQTPGYAVLRLMDYPEWRVSVNGAPLTARPRRNDGLLTIPLRNGPSRVDIFYAATPDVWWGRGLSLASLLALIAFAAAQRKRRPHRLS